MNETLIDIIRTDAQLMEQWAREAKTGGWSTQHVRSMEDRARDLYALLGKLGVAPRASGW